MHIDSMIPGCIFHRRALLPLLLLALVLVAVLPGVAHGQPGAIKWLQTPDATPMGIDVNASPPFILADDFLCTSTGPITQITIWGSWRQDWLPFGENPGAVRFTLSFHADIPAGPLEFSRPGEPLWWRTFEPGDFQFGVAFEGVPEGWLDPPQGFFYPADFRCWKYTFSIPEPFAFVQQGTPRDPVVYWLDVKAVPLDPQAAFGWKTTTENWNDDAVFGFGEEPYPGPWQELRYPPGHELQGSIDLAFALAGPAATRDFGDAWDGPYPTLLASNGARHVIAPGVLLGNAIDAEPDGQPDLAALGDDNAGVDDEDGIGGTMLAAPLIPGESSDFTVTASVPGWLDVWIDFDLDGSWSQAQDHLYSAAVVAGTSTVYFAVPTSATAGLTAARFRFNTVGPLSYDGDAPDGEVEDYAVEITSLDYGDAPDNPFLPGYPTFWMNNGARHVIVPGILLGNQIDAEPDGQPDPNATGDDLNGLADEDGAIWLTPLVPAQQAQVQVTSSVGGNLWVWIDFNRNQSWGEANELVYAGWVAGGPVTLLFNVPGPAMPGPTFARVRFTTMPAVLTPAGIAPDGEVEDYLVTIEEPPPSKWRQDPDLGQTGIDVDDTEPFILADDFLCTQRGRITEVTVWGSWLNDRIPFSEDPGAVDFILSIHADIPAGPNEYSRPGPVLWWRLIPAYSFQYMVWADSLIEGWMRPPDAYDPLGDTVCWRYTFAIPPAEAFVQTGTPDEPVVYWLDVQARPRDQSARFGWKTSLEHWNDDAVWGQGMEPFPGPWSELRYPPGHPYRPQSIDLAFALQSEPYVEEWDFGDAPDGPYPTFLASNGARHLLGRPLYFGNAVDPEPEGLPDPMALGDDNVGLDDEDGVAFNGPLFPSINAVVFITLSQAGWVDGWVDFDGNGSWSDPQDLIVSAPLPAGTTPWMFAVPNTARPGLTFSRFRVNSLGALGPSGAAPDGEVEDHLVEVSEVDWGDAPDNLLVPGYPTLFVNNGARHSITPGEFLGAGIDAEPDGQPDPNALGDDSAGIDDEDGVFWTSLLVPGRNATVDVTASVQGHLEVWIDFNANRSWLDAGENVYSGSVFAGLNTITFAVPGSATSGPTFARFRFARFGPLLVDGPVTGGEVEDHAVKIERAPELKWIMDPDLRDVGMDVNASQDHILADDFRCTATGRILDIVVWGSWRNDMLPVGDPGAVDFFLSIHADIPAAESPTGYSMPGDVLWVRQFPAHHFDVEPMPTPLGEWWMDPPDQAYFPGDFTCWKYTFHVPVSEAFRQTGNPDFPKVYWLDVKALPHDPMTLFGWKTSENHWNDDAVWTLGMEPYLGPWQELRYPLQHPFHPRSIDLAFAIYGWVEEEQRDFGDAPDGLLVPGYPTLLANNGARHWIDPTVYMGNFIDNEADGQPVMTALGDDNNGVDDEDGVTFTSIFRAGWIATWTVTCSTPGYLDVWLDWNGDGTWAAPGDRERIVSAPVWAGTSTFSWHVPITAQPGRTYMRFRFSTGGPLPFLGPAADGEVEDYMVVIHETTDAPGGGAPGATILHPAAPNPFTASTTIGFDLASPERVRIEIFSVDGRRVVTLLDEARPAGRHETAWEGRDAEGREVPAGLYFCRMNAGAFTRTLRLALLR